MADPHTFSRHHYLAWVEQRIEEYKSNLTRDELLELADDAVADLFAARDACTLSEVLLRDAVDELIFRRLRLPSYRRWAHHVS